MLTALVTAATTTALLAQEAPAARDTIRKSDGKILANLEVLSETPEKVEVDTNGDGKADQTLDQNEVKSIDYNGAPASYVQALALFRVRQYDKAVASFREAAADVSVRKWVKDYAAYYIALCLAKQAEAAPAERPKAVQAFEALLRDPNNRWRDDAKSQLGEAYLAAGDRAQALAVFQALEKDAYREETRLNAAAGLAALLMEENRPDEALKRYDTIVAGAKGRFADLYVSALVGKAGAHTALKQYAQAEEFLAGVMKTSTNEDVLAKAHSALGDCFYAQAGALKPDDPDARNKYKAALKHYLWNIVVFYNQKNECARSLLYGGK
ncbi:MAG: hypothetical protein NTZ61_09295, partial [Proteobacteria bacterium]|nr:hypothetical protein [Pseudomonadota bacterium]